MRWQLLLGQLLLVSVAAACSHAACLEAGLELKQLKKSQWLVNTTSGLPEVQNLFCRAGLTGVTRSTANASLALQALCNAQDGTEYFSGSALDAFMASRFASHGTSLYSTAKEPPLSTEPNTPWMLADLVLSSVKTQRKADSWKKVKGEAQLDLLLCSDPSCTLLADLVKVEQEGGAPGRWALATSGIATSTFQTGVGTIAGLGANHLNERPEWVPLELASSGSDGTSIQEVVWQTKASTVTLDSSTCNVTAYPGVKTAKVLPFQTQARLASRPRAPWQDMLVGHYRTNDVQMPEGWLGDRRTRASDVLDPARWKHWLGGCVAVIWPNHTWMHEHGWGESDAECVRQFDAFADFACDGRTWPVAVMDSMFTQAHLLGRANVTRSLKLLSKHVDMINSATFGAGSLSHIEDSTVALLLQHAMAPNIASSVVFPQRMLQGGVDLAAAYGVGGRFGLTVDAKSGFVRTQSQTGCVVSCPAQTGSDAAPIPTAHCGSCALVSVGNATFAVVPAFLDDINTEGMDGSVMFYVAEAVEKLAWYHDSGWFRDVDSLPWCRFPKGQWWLHTQLQEPKHQFVSVLMKNITDLTNIDHELRRVVVNVSDTVHFDGPYPDMSDFDSMFKLDGVPGKVYSLVNASIVHNCTFWDQLGIGFVAEPQRRPAKVQRPPSVADSAFVTFWPLEGNARMPGVTPEFHQDRVFPGYGRMNTQHFHAATRRIAADAARLLDQQVTQELAITDSTKTWLGALWDMSVVILGIVAMACGRADTEVALARLVAWMGTCFNRLRDQSPVSSGLESSKPADGCSGFVIKVAKVLYCCVIVPLGLVMAPAVVIASELKAREQNATGNSSKVGWLAVEVRPDEDDRYVLVGAVSIRTEAAYDHLANVILMINVVLAVVGTLCVWVVSWRRFGEDCKAYRANMPQSLPN
jgi:hypothetical protein